MNHQYFLQIPKMDRWSLYVLQKVIPQKIQSIVGQNYEWDFYDGIHLLYGQLKVTKVAKGKGLIFAQIHGTNPDLNPQLCKLYYDINGDIYVQHKNDQNPSGNQIKLKLTTCKIGETFRFLILLNRGKLTVSINGQKIDVQFKNKYWDKQRFYFKAGNYIQATPLLFLSQMLTKDFDFVLV